MSRIDGYNIYQNPYLNKAQGTKKDQENGAVKKKDGTQRTEEKKPVGLSRKAEELLEKLKKKFSDMDFMVADYENEEEAASYLARGVKEYSVLIDPDTLEKMAADEEVEAEYTQYMEEAAVGLKEMKEQLGDKKDEVVHLGVTIGNDGSLSYFAELEKMSDRQRERIQEQRENKKEEAKEAEKKAEKKEQDKEMEAVRQNYQHGYQRVRVQSDSIEGLMKEIQSVDWSAVKGEEAAYTGSRFDLTV